MKFPDPLLRGRLIRRYKRFLADIELDDGAGKTRLVTAHCANPGSMMGLAEPGAQVWLSPARNEQRKLRYSWELVRVGSCLVGVNPALANRLVEEALASGAIAALDGYGEIAREVRFGDKSRFDFRLRWPGRPDARGCAYIEVKSVTLARPPGDIAEFPDAVTVRGTRHLRELARARALGHRAIMIYVVQREDCRSFRLAGDIDPDYATAFRAARAAGVEAYCHAARVTRHGIDIVKTLPISEPTDIIGA